MACTNTECKCESCDCKPCKCGGGSLIKMVMNIIKTRKIMKMAKWAALALVLYFAYQKYGGSLIRSQVV